MTITKNKRFRDVVVFIVFALIETITSFAFAETTLVQTNNNPENIRHSQSSISSLNVYPGEILEIFYPLINNETPKFYFGREQLTALIDKGEWRIFVGIAANMIPGRYIITIIHPDKSNDKIAFVVKPSRKVLSATQLNNSSRSILNRLQSRKSNSQLEFTIPKLPWANLNPKLPIHYPAKGQWSQNFGELQITNGHNLKQIDHIQLVTTEPQAILAPSDAICLEITKKNGVYSLWLDHGMGLFSHISGLQNISVEEQDKIVSGSMISKIIDSPVVKPHSIQWRLLINGVLINPHSATKLN